MYHYSNIYAGSYKYLREKKNYKWKIGGKKKKKKAVATVATMSLEQTKVAL